MTSSPGLQVLTVVAEEEDAATAKERAAAGEALTRVEFHCLDTQGNEAFFPLNTGDVVVRHLSGGGVAPWRGMTALMVPTAFATARGSGMRSPPFPPHARPSALRACAVGTRRCGVPVLRCVR